MKVQTPMQNLTSMTFLNASSPEALACARQEMCSRMEDVDKLSISLLSMSPPTLVSLCLRLSFSFSEGGGDES